MTNLLNLIAWMIIAGVFLWGVNQFIPMPGMIKSLLNLVVLVVLILCTLQYFGIIKTVITLPTLFS